MIYGYNGSNAAAFPLRKNPRDVVDDPGCNGFGPDDFFRNRVQLAGSGGESRSRAANGSRRRASRLSDSRPSSPIRGGTSDAIVVINSHYFNNTTKPGRGLVRVEFHLAPYDGTRRVVRSVTPVDASYDIDVPPGEVRSVSATWQADGGADPNTRAASGPITTSACCCLTTHTHKRGTHFTITYEEDGKDPFTLLDPKVYDYQHPSIVAPPVHGGAAEG